MSKTIRELAAEKVAEIEAARTKARLEWLSADFGLTPTDFEREGMTIRLGMVPHNCGLQIKQAGGTWSEIIMSWEDLHNFFEDSLDNYFERRP